MNVRSLFARLILPLLVAIAATTTGAWAEEKARVWTSADGRKLTGTVEEKGEGWVKLKVKGKVYKLKMEKLSKKDQDYLKKLVIKKPLEIKTELKSHADKDLDTTIKTLHVDFKNLGKDEELFCLVLWVSTKKSFQGQGDTSIMLQSEGFYDEDGVYEFEAEFVNSAKIGDVYRGWAMRVIDSNGKMVTESASGNAYLKYLEKAFWGKAPKPPKDEDEDK